MADIFDVVADVTRRDILRVLFECHLHESVTGEPDALSPAEREVSVSEIVGRLELSQPTVSKHLKVLREAGLVHVREKGQHRYYQLNAAPLEEIEDWVIPFLSLDFEHGETFADGLGEDAREFASSVGRVFAETSHVVTSAVGRVTPKKWRGQ